ncbi:histidinol dehydrogenase [Flavihumibacter solisilvae]|uniref:Histidinol dehydrogenase n=1 Tax=Flavihumibacter solisilvae TaxID=1349421 RepID=A0A0C1L1C1_9BACT|nr:histidinol dehydrogenase [Flavihumibacter solisilvae]KIC93431.1 histidinol dehydrogenase [Flavihumibacter solisilvae]
MKVFKYPTEPEWESILRRPVLDHSSLRGTVQEIMDQVKQRGDDALRDYTLRFDGITVDHFEITGDEINAAVQKVSAELKTAMQQAAANIRRFHEAQVQQPEVIETMPGIRCWRSAVGIEKVGLYIPGGSAPLFSTVLMLGIPAMIAGCREIILCSPPDKQGNLHPAVIYAAQLTGINRIFKVGGVQAIAAMTYGTASIPAVFKIFGPGNQFVTAAKQLAQQSGVAIDMPAGPSEVAVFADDTANPDFVAADLLSQAEHGIDSQVILVTTSEQLIGRVQESISNQLNSLPRKDIAAGALANSSIILVRHEAEAMDLLNRYAAEHLILSCERAESLAAKVINAGSVFIGHYSPESAGDYASGTNHTLPTNGYATAYSGVSLDSFVKKITFQQLSDDGLKNIAKTVTVMAYEEGLAAHARAVEVRINN